MLWQKTWALLLLVSTSKQFYVDNFQWNGFVFFWEQNSNACVFLLHFCYITATSPTDRALQLSVQMQPTYRRFPMLLNLVLGAQFQAGQHDFVFYMGKCLVLSILWEIHWYPTMLILTVSPLWTLILDIMSSLIFFIFHTCDLLHTLFFLLGMAFTSLSSWSTPQY